MELILCFVELAHKVHVHGKTSKQERKIEIEFNLTPRPNEFQWIQNNEMNGIINNKNQNGTTETTSTGSPTSGVSKFNVINTNNEQEFPSLGSKKSKVGSTVVISMPLITSQSRVNSSIGKIENSFCQPSSKSMVVMVTETKPKSKCATMKVKKFNDSREMPKFFTPKPNGFQWTQNNGSLNEIDDAGPSTAKNTVPTFGVINTNNKRTFPPLTNSRSEVRPIVTTNVRMTTNINKDNSAAKKIENSSCQPIPIAKLRPSKSGTVVNVVKGPSLKSTIVANDMVTKVKPKSKNKIEKISTSKSKFTENCAKDVSIAEKLKSNENSETMSTKIFDVENTEKTKKNQSFKESEMRKEKKSSNVNKNEPPELPPGLRAKKYTEEATRKDSVRFSYEETCSCVAIPNIMPANIVSQ